MILNISKEININMSFKCKYCRVPFQRKSHRKEHETKRGKMCRAYEKVRNKEIVEIRNKVIEEITPVITEKVKSEIEGNLQLQIQTAVLAERERLLKDFYVNHCQRVGEQE